MQACDQVGHETLVHFQGALVVPQVAEPVALVEHAPHLGTETQRVWQQLEHKVAIRGTVAGPAQRGETQRVRGAVGKFEPALQGVGRILGVGEPPKAGIQ